MKLQYHVFLATIVIVLCHACKDAEECPYGCIKSPKDTVYCHKEFLPYWYFTKGSIWIYKRTDTSAVMFDTAEVTYNKASIDFEPSFNSVNALERRMIHVTHSDSQLWSDYMPKSRAVVIESVSDDAEGVSWTWSAKKLLFFAQYFYVQNKVGGGPYKVGTPKTIITPVYTFNNSIPFFNELTGDSIYMTKDVGISKFVGSGETWELVSYHIQP